jgi:CRISPR/Cas system-associated exonuclease Cas4 (RecB family)
MPEAPTLYSRKYRLASRPDYVTREAGGFVPVEVKSRQCGKFGPYPGERAQLLAYCVLTEEEFGSGVEHGELRYANRTIMVPFRDRACLPIPQDLAPLLVPNRSGRRTVASG